MQLLFHLAWLTGAPIASLCAIRCVFGSQAPDGVFWLVVPGCRVPDILYNSLAAFHIYPIHFEWRFVQVRMSISAGVLRRSGRLVCVILFHVNVGLLPVHISM
jgi:hypothetical protein